MKKKKSKTKSKAKAKPKAKPKAKLKVKKAKARKPVKVKAKAKAKVKSSSSKKSKPAAKAQGAAGSLPRPALLPPPNSVLLGFVEDYFAKIGVVALTLKAPLAVGQKIQILGHTTHLDQVVGSMQIDHAPVAEARALAGVGIKISGRARRRDHVYLLK